MEKICNPMEKISKLYILVPTKSAYLPQIFARPPLEYPLTFLNFFCDASGNILNKILFNLMNDLDDVT